MIKRILRGVCGGVIMWVLAGGLVFAGSAPGLDSRLRGNDKKERGNDAIRGQSLLTVHIEGVFDAKVSLIPFDGLKANYLNPVTEVPDVKNGQTATIKIAGQYLPGEFVLRIDYRAKEADSPYPAERIIYINQQDIELTVNPSYINNDEGTKFNVGETENTVYSIFAKENNTKRMPLDSLRQFLLSYDRPKSEFYAQGANEFAQRRSEYNQWLSDQVKKYHNLYVSRLFQFQYIPAILWSGDEKERLQKRGQNYFLIFSKFFG